MHHNTIMTFRRWIIAACMYCLLGVGTATAAHFDDADAAYDRGDYAQSIKLYRPLAAQGFANAQNNLGWMYQYGEGVNQDYQEALKWYRLSAAQGHAEAQNSLGVMYAEGKGVVQDYVRAHMWLNLSAASGYSRAAESRDTVARLMTPQQIAEAQKLARECQARQFKGCN